MSNAGYLSFTKKERIGIITLVTILLATAILPRYFIPPERLETVAAQEIAAPLELARDSFYQTPHYYNREYKKVSKPRQKTLYKKPQFAFNKPVYTRSPKREIIIEVNAADTSAFITLPGIGSKLASRIVLFREKLGGFYHVDQIREVYGLKDSVFSLIFPSLRCDTSLVKKIEINLADREILKTHPYIRWNIADALVAYRSNHGPFSSVHDLAKVNNIDSVALKRMTPYLSFR